MSRPSAGRPIPWRLGVALVALALACREAPPSTPTAAPSPAAKAPAPRELRVALHAPKTLDWTAGLDTEGTTLARNLYEGLTVMAPDGRGTEPGAAGEPQGTPDGRTWTFRLRDDARWSTGEAVTAADFVEGWTRCLAAGSPCGVPEPFDRLLAAPEGGVEAVDERTIRLRLARPHPLTAFALATTSFLPLPRAVAAAHPADWMLPPQGAWNGPWKLASYRPGVEAVLEPNPHHRAAAGLKLDRVRVVFVQTQQNADDLFRAGDADLVFGRVPIERIRELRAKADPSLALWPAACTYFLGLNTESGPTADLSFRRALAASIDREKLALQVLGMGQTPATAFAPPSLWASPPPPSVATVFSPERARETYRASAHAAAPVPVPYLLNEDAGNRLIAEAVQRDVQEALGLRLDLQTLEWSSLLDRLAKGQFAVSRMTWCAALPDPADLVRSFRSGAEDNPSRYKNPDVDAALDRLAQAATVKEREDLLAEIEARLAADVAAIPLYHLARALLVRPCLKGLVPNAFDLLPFARLDLSACPAQGE